MPHTKAILFDFDGTLYQSLPASGDAFVEYIRSLGYKVSDEDKLRAEHWTHFYFAHSLEIRADGKTYPAERDFWVNFSRRRMVALGLPSAEAKEIAAQVSDYMENTHKPIYFVPQDAVRVLKSFRSAGYVLGVVSNREKPFWGKLVDLNLSQYFQFALAGGEIPVHKPDKIVFERALELADTAASETLYVGDNYFADVVGARRAGMTPVLYDPARIFADADCAVICSFDELPALVK